MPVAPVGRVDTHRLGPPLNDKLHRNITLTPAAMARKDEVCGNFSDLGRGRGKIARHHLIGEPHPVMAAVAKRLVGRMPAAA